MAPTIASAYGAWLESAGSASKWQIRRSLRANSRGNGGYRKRSDAEDASRHMHGFAQDTGQRRVHAMIVARRQVHGDETAVEVRCGSVFVGKQLGDAEVEALGLEDAPVVNRTCLTDAAVRRAEDGVGVVRGNARAGFSSRVKKALKLAYAAGSGWRASAMSTL